MKNVRTMLLQAGVKNLKEFGYPSVTTENILTDYVFAKFFESMLKDNLGARADIDKEINILLAEIDKLKP